MFSVFLLLIQPDREHLQALLQYTGICTVTFGLLSDDSFLWHFPKNELQSLFINNSRNVSEKVCRHTHSK